MVAETSPDELHAKLDDEDVAVIDIRDPSSYSSGHIPGAENLPAQSLTPAVFDREWPEEIVVSCYIGKSSKRVASILDSNIDADVSSLRGGFEEWDGEVASGTNGDADLGPSSPF